jgi:hypothetical protein
MRGSAVAVVLAAVFLGTSGAAAQTLELLRQPVNGAIGLPLGQGLGLVHSAEPLGLGRFRVLLLNRTFPIALPDLGSGSAYTGDYGLAYGIKNNIDASLLVPFYLDSVSGLSKYGTGDLLLGVKWSRPARATASYYTAVLFGLGLPLGYKGQHGLDQVGGIRPFSSSSLDLGMQMLADMHFRYASVYLNGGLFRSFNVDIRPQLIYGLGLEFGRRSKRGSLNIEYQNRLAFAQRARAVGVLKVGTRVSAYRGLEVELNREFGFYDYPTGSLFTFGVRLHGYLSPRRRLEPRYVLYQPPPKPKRAYAPTRVLRLAVLDFDGFEESNTGRRLVDKIRARLAPHDSIEVVDLRRYSDVPRSGPLSLQQALDLAGRLPVDVVVSGTVSDLSVKRFSGTVAPYLVELPQTDVEVALTYRVMWYADPGKTQMETFTETVTGTSQVRKRVRLLPADQHDITVHRTAQELVQAQEKALDSLAGKMLASMAARFTWIPPDLAP